MTLAAPIPLGKLCRLAKVSRAGFYRRRTAAHDRDADMELRNMEAAAPQRAL
ncbi:MAG: hypothetical protein ACRD27_03260 [Terracidiphilus sp.]